MPVVLIVGCDDSPSIEKAYEAGASDFVEMPIQWPTLSHRLDFLLRAGQERRSLAQNEKKNRALLEALPDTSVVVDPAGLVVEHLLGSDMEGGQSLIGRSIDEAFPPEIVAQARRVLHKVTGARLVKRFAVRKDKQRWFEARFLPQPDGMLLIVTRDITERLKAERRINYLAYYDTLTGLPNRQMLLLKVKEMIGRTRQEGTNAALLYLDLDRFKLINDNLGRAVGDALLRAVAERLQNLVKKSASNESASGPRLNLVARLGGDEFALFADGLQDEQQAGALADQIRATLDAPFDFGHHFAATPSIGVAMYPGDSEDIEDLLVKSEMAMYQAKEQGRNVHAFFGQSMAVRSLRRLSIESDLRRALEKGDFRLHYQPKLDLRSGKINGVEALLRWPHSDKGFIAPDKFIPVAEDSGLIQPLGAWVLNEVCAQMRRWSEKGLGHVTVAANVSANQFMRQDFVEGVLQTLKNSKMPGSRLELEITESVLMRNLNEARSTLNRLRAEGIAVSIDDFGTGYSSLGYLRGLPVHTLKIDRSFVKDLLLHEDAAAICAAIIAMARELKIHVVAEGVENQRQLDFLQLHGCEQAQGFLIGKPVEASDVEALLRGEDSGRFVLSPAKTDALLTGKTRRSKQDVA
jgi:diguanylate cyclase (GGDEF)-like protein